MALVDGHSEPTQSASLPRTLRDLTRYRIWVVRFLSLEVHLKLRSIREGFLLSKFTSNFTRTMPPPRHVPLFTAGGFCVKQEAISRITHEVIRYRLSPTWRLPLTLTISSDIHVSGLDDRSFAGGIQQVMPSSFSYCHNHRSRES